MSDGNYHHKVALFFAAIFVAWLCLIFYRKGWDDGLEAAGWRKATPRHETAKETP